MTKKVTKREMLNAIKAVEAVAMNEEMVAFIDHELELLDKKSSNKKPTATQEANVAIKDEIVKVLTDADAPMTASEVLKASAEFDGMSNQKISALLRQLIADGKVVKATDKKKSVFSLA